MHYYEITHPPQLILRSSPYVRNFTQAVVEDHSLCILYSSSSGAHPLQLAYIRNFT